MYNRQKRTPLGRMERDLADTSDQVPPGFNRLPYPYESTSLGMTDNEQWRNQRVLRNDTTYNNDVMHPTQMYYPTESGSSQQPQPQPPVPVPANPSESGVERAADNVNDNTREGTQEINARRRYAESLYRDIVNSIRNLSDRITNRDILYPELMNRSLSVVPNESSQHSGGVQSTQRKVTTHQDPRGNVTSCVEETTTVSKNCMPNNGGNPGRQLNFSEQRGNVSDTSMPSLQNASMPAQSTRLEQQNTGESPHSGAFDEYLDDVSAPSYAHSTAGRPMNATTINISEISAPTFTGINYGQSTTNGRLDDVTMPSGLMGASGDSGHLAAAFPCECLDDVTMPSYGHAFDASNCQAANTMPSDYLNDVSAPSFGRSMNYSESPQYAQVSMPSQNINDISEPTMYHEYMEDVNVPSYAGASGTSRPTNYANQQQSMPSQASSYERSERGRTPDHLGIGGLAEYSRRQQNMPSEYLDNVSAPSFGRNMSQEASQRRMDRSMPTQNYYGYQECVENITMPSLAGDSGASNAPQQMYLPNERLDEVSAPTFGSNTLRSEPSRHQPMYMSTNENLENETMPSFAGVSGSSRARPPMNQQRVSPGQASLYGRNDQGAATSEYIDNISMPAYGGVSEPSRNYRNMSAVRLADITEPLHGNSSSYGASPRRQNRAMPQQNYYTSTECVQNVSGASRPQRSNMPSERLDDVSAPSFGVDMSYSGSARRQQMPMPSENLYNISAPLYERTETREFLNDISMPIYGEVSVASRTRLIRRHHRSIPTHNICDISPPSYNVGQTGTMPSNFLDDITAPSYMSTRAEDMSMPTFGGALGSSRGQPTAGQQQTVLLPNYRQGTGPSYARSDRGAMPSEYINDISMPSYGRGSESPRRQQTQMPSERLDDITAPSYGQNMSLESSRRTMSSTRRNSIPNECLEDVTMPSYRDYTGPSSRQQMNLPSERINDVSAPSLARSPSRHQQMSLPTENLNEVTAPSFASSSRARSPRRQAHSLPSQNIGDTSAPLFNSSNGQRTMTNERIEDTSMPTFASQAQRPISNEYLDDGNGPSGPSTARSLRWQSVLPTQNINDISAPSYASGQSNTYPYLDNETMPSMYESTAGYAATGRRQTPYPRSAPLSSTVASKRREVSLPSERLNDASAPSYQRSLSRGRAQNTQPMRDTPSAGVDTASGYNSNRRPELSYAGEYLNNVNPPGLVMNNSSLGNRRCMPYITTKYCRDEYMQQDMVLRSRSFPCLTNELNIGDITAPSMNSTGQDYSSGRHDVRPLRRRPRDLTNASQTARDVPTSSGMNRSRPNQVEFARRRSHSVPWPEGSRRDRFENMYMSSDQLDNLCAPSTGANKSKPASSSTRSKLSAHARSHLREQLNDGTVPTLASTVRDLGQVTATSGIDLSSRRGDNNNKNPCLCPNSQVSQNIANTSMPSQLAMNSGGHRQATKRNKSKRASSRSTSKNRSAAKKANCKERKTVATPPSCCAPENATVVQEVILTTSVTSFNHTFNNCGMSNNNNNIDDVTMPMHESTGINSTAAAPASSAAAAAATQRSDNQIENMGQSTSFQGVDNSPRSRNNYEDICGSLASHSNASNTASHMTQSGGQKKRPCSQCCKRQQSSNGSKNNSSK